MKSIHCSLLPSFKTPICGAGEKAQWLNTLTVLLGDQDLVPSTIWLLTAASRSSSSRSNALFWPPLAHIWHTYGTHI